MKYIKKLAVLCSVCVGLLFCTTIIFAHSTNLSQCNANNPTNCPSPTQICGNGQHTGNPHCETPTPTAKPTVTLTPTPTKKPKCTPTPTMTIVPTVTPTDEVTPTPTEEVTPTPTEETTPTPTVEEHHEESGVSSPSTAQAPQCGATAPTKVGANFHILRKGDDAIAKWVPTEGNKAHIYYKQVGASDWQYSVRDIDNTGYFEIHGLGNLDITFALQQANDCAGGPLTTAVVDGATKGWVLFR